jgi:hypothetical protein
MVRLPKGFHPQAVRTAPTQSYRPGWRGSGMQPMPRTPIAAYTGKITGVTLTGGEVQGFVPAGGRLVLSNGPQGLGTVWYPVQLTVSTTTGALDGSTCQAYLGAQGVPITLVGTLFPGGAGTIALGIPAMTPGQELIFIWTNAHPGDTAAANVGGTMDALTTTQSGS